MTKDSRIPLRRLGRNGPLLPAIGLGCMNMSPGVYGDNSNVTAATLTADIDVNDRDIASSLDVLSHAIDAGSTFWDTANVYGMGHNERLLAYPLKEHRDKIFICTKLGFKLGADGQLTVSCEPNYTRQCCEESLARLGVDTIDLYYQHRVDRSVPIEKSVGAMAELVQEGKVRYLGLSECSAETLRRAHKVHPIAAVQMEYSLWTRDIEKNGLLDTCKELGIAVVAYSPLGRGFLTGSIRSVDDLPAGDWRRTNPRFAEETITKNLEVVSAIERMAEKKGCTTSQICIAWVLKQWDGIFVIPGTKRLKYLQDNIGAGDVILTDEEEKELRQQVESLSIAGERYHSDSMDLINA